MRMLILLCLIFLAMPAGAVRKYTAKGARPEKIDSLYFFEPVSNTGLIAYRNDLLKSDSISALNVTLQQTVIRHHAGRLKLAGKIPVDDSGLVKRIKLEILELMKNAAKKTYFEELGHRSVIDSVMDAGGKRFALIMFNQGFVRTKENKRWAMHKANLSGFSPLAVAIASKDAFAVPLLSSSSDVYVMIIDAQENRTYFFNTSFSSSSLDYDPSNVDDINTQFYNAFKGFFFPASNSPRI